MDLRPIAQVRTASDDRAMVETLPKEAHLDADASGRREAGLNPDGGEPTPGPDDFMRPPGFILRDPRRVRTDNGQRACLACLATWLVPSVERHAAHPALALPDLLPQIWRTTDEMRRDAVPAGTTLRLDAFRTWTFVHDGINDAQEAEWLLTALHGPVAGQSFLALTSGLPYASPDQLMPGFLEPACES
jgi:hypothetical protein